jgi:hypothetical protein
MKRQKILASAAVCSTRLSGIAVTAQATDADQPVVLPSPNGIDFPADYRDWRVISVSHRTDHHSMRVILGNDTAIEAARQNKINPWPDGAALAKVVWKEGAEEDWAPAIAPQEFIHVEFMFKDTEKWADTGGWVYTTLAHMPVMPKQFNH